MHFSGIDKLFYLKLPGQLQPLPEGLYFFDAQELNPMASVPNSVISIKSLLI
jgi:hypothetical protein